MRILGRRSDIPELLGAADLFVSTSRNEGLPLNVMEAMAAGTPFVASGIAQIRELVAGDADLKGHLYEQPPLVGPVLGAPDNLGGLGMRGRQIIGRDFSLTRLVNNYEQLYRQACGRG